MARTRLNGRGGKALSKTAPDSMSNFLIISLLARSLNEKLLDEVGVASSNIAGSGGGGGSNEIVSSSSAKTAAEGDSSDSAAGMEWNCFACTMLNSSHAQSCCVCDTPRVHEEAAEAEVVEGSLKEGGDSDEGEREEEEEAGETWKDVSGESTPSYIASTTSWGAKLAVVDLRKAERSNCILDHLSFGQILKVNIESVHAQLTKGVKKKTRYQWGYNQPKKDPTPPAPVEYVYQTGFSVFLTSLVESLLLLVCNSIASSTCTINANRVEKFIREYPLDLLNFNNNKSESESNKEENKFDKKNQKLLEKYNNLIPQIRSLVESRLKLSEECEIEEDSYSALLLIALRFIKSLAEKCIPYKMNIKSCLPINSQAFCEIARAEGYRPFQPLKSLFDNDKVLSNIFQASNHFIERNDLRVVVEFILGPTLAQFVVSDGDLGMMKCGYSGTYLPYSGVLAQYRTQQDDTGTSSKIVEYPVSVFSKLFEAFSTHITSYSSREALYLCAILEHVAEEIFTFSGAIARDKQRKLIINDVYDSIRRHPDLKSLFLSVSNPFMGSLARNDEVLYPKSEKPFTYKSILSETATSNDEVSAESDVDSSSSSSGGGSGNDPSSRCMSEIDGYVRSFAFTSPSARRNSWSQASKSEGGRCGDSPDLVISASRRILNRVCPDVYSIEGVLIVSGLIELIAMKICEQTNDLVARMINTGMDAITTELSFQLSIDAIFPPDLAMNAKAHAVKIVAKDGHIDSSSSSTSTNADDKDEYGEDLKDY